MKVFVLFALFALAAADTEYYTTADDNLNIEAVLADLPTLHSFIDCFLDKGPCTEVTQSYKELIPDSIATLCARCSDAQKHMGNVFFKGLKDILPEEYVNFRAKYDPENKYFDDFERSFDGY